MHHKTSRPAATIARPRAAPSTAALEPERARLGMFMRLQLLKRLWSIASRGLEWPFEKKSRSGRLQGTQGQGMSAQREWKTGGVFRCVDTPCGDHFSRGTTLGHKTRFMHRRTRIELIGPTSRPTDAPVGCRGSWHQKHSQAQQCRPEPTGQE